MAPHALAARTLATDWPRIRAAIDDGRLPLVGLIRHHGLDPMQLDRDHQVLAFAYAVDEGPTGRPSRFACTTPTGRTATT